MTSNFHPAEAIVQGSGWRSRADGAMADLRSSSGAQSESRIAMIWAA